MQELVVQSMGGRALCEKVIADKLALTPSQRQAILKVNIQPILDKATGQKVTPEDRESQAIKILTPQQAVQFEKLRGQKASFDILNSQKLESIHRRTENAPRPARPNSNKSEE